MSFARVSSARLLRALVVPMNGLQDPASGLTGLDKNACTSNSMAATTPIVARMDNSATQRRALAALFAACAIAFVVLLAAHPGGNSHTIAESVALEIATEQVGRIVHGGAILVLMLLLGAHVAFARTTAPSTLAATIAVVLFGAGSVLLTGSLVVDGFVVPALAHLFLAAKDSSAQSGIESQIQFAGAVIGVLMPMSLAVFGASAIAYTRPLMSLGGRARFAGLAVGAAGLGSVLLIGATPSSMRGHAVLGALVLMVLWQFGFVVVLLEKMSLGQARPGQD
jgi:hypothetical protein